MEGDNTTVNLLSPTSIAAIVASINAQADATKSLFNSMEKITKIGVDNVIKSSKDAAKITSAIASFSKSIVDVVETLANSSLNGSDSEKIEKMFIDANEYFNIGPDGKIDEKNPVSRNNFNKEKGKMVTHQTLPAMIATIAGTFGTMAKAMEEISKMDMGIKNLVKFKVNMVIFGEELKDILKLITETFSELNKDDKLKDLVELLVSDPETVSTVIDNNQKMSSDGKFATDILTKTSTEVKKGKQGFLDAIMGVISMITAISSLEPANPLTFYIKLKLSMKQLNRVVEEMLNLGNRLDAKQRKKLISIGNTFEKLNEVFMYMEQAFEELGKIGNPMNFVVMNFASSILTKFLGEYDEKGKKKKDGIVDIIFNFLDSEKFNEFCSDSKNTEVISKINSLKSIIDSLSKVANSLKELCVNITLTGLLVIPAIIAAIGIMIFAYVLKAVFFVLESAFNDKNYKDLVITMDNMRSIANNLLITTLCLAGTFAIMALTGLFFGKFFLLIFAPLLGIITIALMMRLVSFLLRNVVMDKETTSSIIQLTIIIGMLSAVFVLMALTGLVIAENEEMFAIVWIATMITIGILCVIAESKNIIKDSGVAMLLMTSAVALIAVSLLIMGLAGMFYVNNPAAFVGFGMVIGMLFILVRVFKSLSKIQGEIYTGAVAMLVMSASLVVLSVGLLIMGVVFNMYKKVTLEEIGKVLLFVGAYIALTYLATFAAVGAAAMVLIGASLIVVSIGLLAMRGVAALGTDGMDAVKDLIKSLIGVYTEAGIKFVLIVPGAAALILMSVSLMFLSGAIALINLTIKKADALIDKKGIKTINYTNDKKSKEMPVLEAIIRSFMDSIMFLANPLRLLELTLATPAILLVTVNAALILGAITAIEKAYSISKDTDWTAETGKKIMAPVDCFVNAVWESLFKKGGIGAKLIIIGSFMEQKFGQIAKIAESIGKISQIVVDMSSFAIPTKFDKEGNAIDYRTITEDDFINTKANILTLVSGFVEACTQSGIDSLTVKGLKETKKKFKKLAKITGPISDMLQVVKDLANGEIEDYVKEGEGESVTYKATGKKINIQNFILKHSGDIQESIKNLVVAFGSAISGDVQNQDVIKAIKSTSDITDNLAPMTESIKNMIDSAIFLSEKSKDIDFNTLSGNIYSIISAYTIPFTGGDGKEKLFTDSFIKQLKKNENALAFDNLGLFVDVVNKLGNTKDFNVENHTKSTENFVKLIEKANSIDTNKIKSVTSMMEQMARFSESIDGNFEKLADTLNDKLVDLLEKIHGTLEGLNTNENINAIPAKFGESDAQTNTRIKEETTKEPESKETDLSGLQSTLDEIQNLVSYMKSNGIKLNSNTW